MSDENDRRIAELEAEVRGFRDLGDFWRDRTMEAQVERDEARAQRDELAETLRRAYPYLDGIVSIEPAPTMKRSARPGFRSPDGRKHNPPRPAEWWDELREIRAALAELEGK